MSKLIGITRLSNPDSKSTRSGSSREAGWSWKRRWAKGSSEKSWRLKLTASTGRWVSCYHLVEFFSCSFSCISCSFSCIEFIMRPEKNFSEAYYFQLRLWFSFFFLFFCYHNNSWKAQPIQTKFSHMTFDWNGSAMSKNGHRGSQVTPSNRGLLHPLKINIPPISTNPNQILTHDFWLE